MRQRPTKRSLHADAAGADTPREIVQALGHGQADALCRAASALCQRATLVSSGGTVMRAGFMKSIAEGQVGVTEVAMGGHLFPAGHGTIEVPC